MRLPNILFFLLCVSSWAFSSVQGPPRKPQTNLPSDRQRRYVQIITTNSRVYTIPFKGYVDGVMTRMPISYGAYKQGWQPNLYCRIENIGDTDVINPWLTVNGKGDWRTLEKIVAEAIQGCTTDAEKARALWEWERKHRFHACTWDQECDDAVKVHNVYGYTLCGNDAVVLDDMFKAAGLKTRPGRPVGHVVTEAFYEGEWHMLDGDEHVICLRRDNKTIASEAEIVRDHDLMKRTHTYSIGQPEDPLLDQFSASLYGYEGERGGERPRYTKHTMFFRLRPGESIEWRWTHIGKEYSAGEEAKPGEPWHDGIGSLRQWGATAYDNLRNGKWIYRVPLEKPVWRKGVVSAENVAEPAASSVPGGKAGLYPANTTKPVNVVWRLASPWIFVGAQIRASYRLVGENAYLRWSFSSDNQKWQSVYERHGSEEGYAMPRFDSLISPRGKPMYEFFVRLEFQGEAGSVVNNVIFDNDVQMSLLGMPELVVGDNRIEYTDETPEPHLVKITHAWLERTEWRPPTAPPAPIFPRNGATVEGTQFVFKWQPAQIVDAAGRRKPETEKLKIVDYHIEVYERADLRWPLSPNFEKLVSKTPSKGKAEWRIPYVGLLNPGQTYYWRVRALDSNGVWGPWSEAWTFRCEAPGVPLNLQAYVQSDGTIKISWQPNPEGRKPVAYKVYGSDEQGFTASDTEYMLRTGRGFCDTMEEYNAKAQKGEDPFWGDVRMPPNLITKTEETSLTVVGPHLPWPNVNKAFYRVVAIDEKGNESGASDYVAVPRPYIYTAPSPVAHVGQLYRYEPKSIFSIGHLTCNGSYNAAFWHREKLIWTLDKGPSWLKLRGDVLEGIPSSPGRFEVVLKVTNNKQQSAQQRFMLEVQP